MTNYNQLSDAELEREIASRVMGFKVLSSLVTAVCAEGDWSVAADSEPENWTCRAEKSYCYIDPNYDPVRDKEECENYLKEVADLLYGVGEIEGVPTAWLNPVPQYSRDIKAAFEVVAKMRTAYPAMYFSIYSGDMAGDMSFMSLRARFGDSNIAVDNLEQLPKAICVAALREMDAMKP